MWDLSSSEFRLWRLLSPCMRRCEFRQTFIYVSEESAASIFRVENMLTNQWARRLLSATCASHYCCILLLSRNYACLSSRYLATAFVQILISTSPPSNGYTCHIIFDPEDEHLNFFLTACCHFKEENLHKSHVKSLFICKLTWIYTSTPPYV
jgi:hypothetical protein